MSWHVCYICRMSVRITGRSEQVTLRMPHDLLDALRTEAERQRRPYTALAIEALRAYWDVPQPAPSDDRSAGRSADVG